MTNNETKSTPMAGPWYAKMYVDKDGEPESWGVRNALFSVCNIVAQDMEDIANGIERATAELIVKCVNSAPDMAETIERQAAQIQRLQENLGFYANPGNYSDQCPGREEVTDIGQTWEPDNGDIARAALAESGPE